MVTQPLTERELAELIDGLAGLPYGGEPVDQRTHALQTGWQAWRSGADDELLVAATLHDIGRAEQVRAAHPGLPHEAAGASWARPRVGARAAWIIGQHVPAKRYLVATDPTYGALLSPVSVDTLRRQGGPMDGDEVAAFENTPNHREAVAVRRWDDAAKVPDGPTLALERLLAAYRRLVAL
jgi:predicted HD phosphohydrolase